MININIININSYKGYTYMNDLGISIPSKCANDIIKYVSNQVINVLTIMYVC